MDLGISGKVAMVAAASKGIGLAIAKELANEGCRLSICARSEDGLANAAAILGHGVRGYVCDVAKGAYLTKWFNKTCAELGPPEILVTNTGGPPAGSLESLTEDDWRVGIENTLMNVLRLSQLVAPKMREAGWGRILHVTSLYAKEPSSILPISSSLRAGLMALTKIQARDLAPSGITVNGLLPGHTLTDRQRHLAQIRAASLGITEAEALERQAREIPIGRLAAPEEIAAAAAFLCSTRASYVTGISLLVDGGFTQSFG